MKKPKKIIKKPTGKITSLQLAPRGVHPSETRSRKLQLPDSNEATEQFVVDRFISAMNRKLSPSGQHFELSNPRQNPQNDLDFTVTESSGDAYIECLEAAPLDTGYDKTIWLID